MTSLTGPASADAAAPPKLPVSQPQAVGIDYGTSSSAVARLDADGVPRILPNPQGGELTESMLSFEADGEVRVGQIEPERADAGLLVRAVKRHLGNRGYAVEHAGRRLSPEVLSALILRRLSDDASRFGTLGSAILTVPSYFFAPNRRATWSTARLANLPVLELLAEPVAAALARLWRIPESFRDSDRERKILVFDLGGGTFDVTIVRARGGRVFVAATEGDNHLGGIDWTERLVDFAAEKFKRRNGLDPRDDPAACRQLFANCEAAKCRLTRTSRAVIDVAGGGLSMPLGLSRDEFEQITHDLLARARDAAEFLFESSAIEPDDLDEILLVGGGSKIPAIARMMTDLCGRPVDPPDNPQRSVVEGAAIYAAALAVRGGDAIGQSAVQERLASIQLGDVNAHSVGIALDDPAGQRFSVNHILIPRNTVLPKSVKARFVTSLANPEGIALRIVEGEAPEVTSCTTISHWRILGLPPDLPAGTPIEIDVRCDAQREVSVEVCEPLGTTAPRVERVTSHSRIHADNQQILASFRLV